VIAESKNYSGIRERLLARQRELNVQHQRLVADRRRAAEPLSADSSDRAIQQANDEVVDSIDAAVENEARSIAVALSRLDAGRYGFCETCGGEIGAKRLAAVPYADQCQSCAAQAGS
jgi:RNA polymerase-binding transcription factor DksA